MTPTAASYAVDSSTPISLIAVMLSPNVDTRIVETLVNYREPSVSSLEPSTRAPSSVNIRPKLNILKEHQCEWWSREEWTQDGGDDAFWKRMSESQ